LGRDDGQQLYHVRLPEVRLGDLQEEGKQDQSWSAERLLKLREFLLGHVREGLEGFDKGSVVHPVGRLPSLQLEEYDKGLQKQSLCGSAVPQLHPRLWQRGVRNL